MKGRRKQARPNSRHTEEPLGIAERVRFWEEQDRINQVLIPRVIRQHELLTKHIEEHENLPELFHRELLAAMEQQSRRFEEEQRKYLDNQSELFRRELRAALEEQYRGVRLLRWLVIGAFVVSLAAMTVSLWA